MDSEDEGKEQWEIEKKVKENEAGGEGEALDDEMLLEQKWAKERQ